jgi:squalene-hopene/tetraprenyl-beta-curcumene cyclase
MAAGKVRYPSVARDVQWLPDRQADDGVWPEESYTGTGFPRAFYLRYHGYAKIFPPWAVSRYRKLPAANCVAVLYGI